MPKKPFARVPAGLLALALLSATSPFAADSHSASPTPDDTDAASASAAEAAAGASAEPAAESQPGAQSSSGSQSSAGGKEKKGSPVSVRYHKGLHFETDSNAFKARIRWRVQMRATDVSSEDLLGEEDGIEEEAGFRIRRARFKLDGHAYKEWLKYYVEYGFINESLLTWQLDVARYEKATLRVGQWKVLYNRERVDSSGKQQFVDRSIVNNPFTIDRQQGIHLAGRLFKGSRGDSRYAVGVYTGTGRGGDLEDDGRPMYVGRWQWNFLKRDVPFTQSDIKYTPKTIASFALAGASNEGRFTRWSSSGGGQLPGLGPGDYRTSQWMAEFALMRHGLSVQSEYHFKEVKNLGTGEIGELRGFYGQVGYFFHSAAQKFPEKLELALRFADVDSEQGAPVPADEELTFVVNYFFAGHDNKLTADISHLASTLEGGSDDDGIRIRFQWDISF